MTLRKLLTTSILTLGIGVVSGTTVHAAAFNPGRIIDDSVMTNSSSMTATQIQAFLSSKVPACDTNGTVSAADFGRPDLNHAQYAALRGWQAPPYTCLRDKVENGLTAAQIIYNVSQQYSINPQVFLVLLQKESSLVTDTWPLNWQYSSATGYGCPDNTPGVCDASYRGLTNQITWAAKLFRNVINQSPTWYSPYIKGNNFIQWSPIASCGGSVVNVQNWSTAALYDYTPYQPNQAALNAGYGMGDGCSAYGNRNFFLFFNDWFGSTIGTISNGIDYAPVFDNSYYLLNNPDVKQAFGNNAAAVFQHFINYGMNEGRTAAANFNVTSYKNANPDLRVQYGSRLQPYYIHYILYGRNEGRIATGNAPINYIKTYNGIDYSSVYNYTFYLATYADMSQNFSNDDAGALRHFVTQGMMEGRQASPDFNVTSYRSLYYDLRRILGSDTKAYFLHYITNGKAEGRTGTSGVLGGTSTLRGVDYSSIYTFNTYANKYVDIKDVFGLDDSAALSHFVHYGMAEGRQASPDFDVYAYRDRYPDLKSAFGNNLVKYYIHYLYYGKAEGRSGN